MRTAINWLEMARYIYYYRYAYCDINLFYTDNGHLKLQNVQSYFLSSQNNKQLQIYLENDAKCIRFLVKC